MEHMHVNDIEMYKWIDGDKNIKDDICLLNYSHGINQVNYDTVIENFKLSKNKVNGVENINLLSQCLCVQLIRYMWRFNEVLNKRSMDENRDIGWRPFSNISYIYDISEDVLECMKEIYFKNLNNIPFKNLTFEEFGNVIKRDDIPYLIDDIYIVVDIDTDNSKSIKKLIKKI